MPELVRIVHPVVGESEVMAESVEVWLDNGWTLADGFLSDFTSPEEDAGETPAGEFDQDDEREEN